jgi:predicted PurR-regulated permease PerM
MAPTDQETEVVLPAEEPEEMPLPSDPTAIFLGGLFVLALLATAYVASEIVLPLVFAIILTLLLQPASRLLERLHVPRVLAALLLILALFGTIVGLGAAVSGPAGTWAAKLPEGIPRLQERLSFLRQPIDTLQRFLQQVENIGETAPSPSASASERGPTLLTKLFTGTRNFASGLFTTVLLLVSGDIFLHRLVEISSAEDRHIVQQKGHRPPEDWVAHSMGTERIAPGIPHIQNQKTSEMMTRTGLRVNRLPSIK